jgi:hypothetical protein
VTVAITPFSPPADLWCKLPEVEHYRAAVAAVDVASRSGARPNAMSDLLNDPEAQRLLPPLGYAVETEPPSRYNSWRSVRKWSRHHYWNYFFPQLGIKLAERVRSVGNPDGSVTQTISAEAAANAWSEARTMYWGAHTRQAGPDPLHLSIHLALALHEIPGSNWEITPDNSLTRLLPAWPLHYAPPGAEVPLKVEVKGLTVDCVQWCVLPTEMTGEAMVEIAFVSFVGGQKKCKAAWAALMDNKRDPIKLPSCTRSFYGTTDVTTTTARRVDGRGVYDTFWNDRPLTKSRMAHVAIVHKSYWAPQPLRPFLHLVGADGTPHLPHFFAQLDRALPLPLFPAWAEQLWQLGIEKKLIQRLPSFGCQGYWVAADSETAWAAIVSQCAGAKTLRLVVAGNEEQKEPIIVASLDDDE